MNWINFFFYVIVLNSLTGTVAYLLCKLLALVAKKYNAIRIIYPLYRLVLLFYIVPLGYIYIRCKCFVRFGANTLGDGFLGNQVIYEVMQCCLLIWFSGMLCVGLHYLKKWKKYRWICRKNIPFHGEEYRAVLQKLYPGKNWKKVRFCTNYTIDSPCVMGVFHHVIVFKALNYPMKDIELVLMHEGTHIVRRDNLGKRVEYMIRWQKAGKKTGVSVLLALALVIGSSVTAFASSTQVALQQDDIYRETRVQETDVTETEDLEEYVIPADQVDEEKWNNAIVYDDELLDPLSVQKNFDWKIPGNRFVRSGAFIKKAGSTIVVSCYVYDDRYHHVGIRRPDGSMLYVNGMHQVTKTFNCETTGTYYVYVENMRSKEIRAAGYFIK